MTQTAPMSPHQLGIYTARQLLANLVWFEPMSARPRSTVSTVGYAQGPVQVILGFVSFTGHMRLDHGEEEFAGLTGQVKDSLHLFFLPNPSASPAELIEFEEVCLVVRRALGAVNATRQNVQHEGTSGVRWSWKYDHANPPGASL